MKRKLLDFADCYKCIHENLCKYCEDIKKTEIDIEDIPVIELKANCSRFISKDYDSINKDFNDYSSVTFGSEACKGCPNNPANGGSGICNCLLGLPQVTY